MAAPANNSFWKRRSKHGRDKIFSSSKILLEQAYEYFQTCDDNPWYKNEAIKSGESVGDIIKVPAQRPYTLTGLQLFLNIDKHTWYRYKDNSDFQEAIETIDKIIYTQKFEGAVVGVFNANIITRDLGLTEKVESKNTNYNYNTQKLPPEKIKKISEALESEY